MSVLLRWIIRVISLWIGLILCYCCCDPICNLRTESCENNKVGQEKWKWDLDDRHRCNIVRMSRDELHFKFGPIGLPPLYHEPIVIYDDHPPVEKSTTTTMDMRLLQQPKRRNLKFAKMTLAWNIVSFFPSSNFQVTLSSSNSVSAFRRTIPLSQYINETLHSETYPYQFSNETWYLFGETYSEEWNKLLSHFELPPCHTCTKELSALAFGIGNRGSGVQWHFHGPGFSEAIHGRKHWIFYPPNKRPNYNPDFTSRHWMEEIYTTIRNTKDLPLECTLHPGDMIYFPDGWYHATINLDHYTAFVSTFTADHSL